jgi:hypothetical protein
LNIGKVQSVTANSPDVTSTRSAVGIVVDVLVFLTVAGALLIANWHLIDVANVEASDFAANSLLVLKAKKFHLLVGNYSRVGFNHPGPAILYVMALGEWLFFDCLRLVPSPFSGQIMAVALFAAFWIAAIFSMLRRIERSTVFAVLSIAFFLFIASIHRFEFFGGMWFPDIYFFPFAAALIAASRFASGKADMLFSLSLSIGFLSNGHVAFIAILGLILLISLAWNTVTLAKGTGRRIVSQSYLRENGKVFGFACALLFLFFVPMLVETVRYYPGPIYQYAAFGGGHHANSITQAIGYTARFWDYKALYVVGTLVLLIGAFVPVMRRPPVLNENLRSIAAALTAANLAMLFYAKFGVDQLDMLYIGYFYYAVPALTITVAVGYAVHRLNGRWLTTLSLLLAAALAVLTYRNVDRDPAYAALFKQPKVTDIYASMIKIKPAGRLVLDAVVDDGWGVTWSDLLGTELYAARRHVDLFCVDRNWHISFTFQAHCTDDELRTGPRYFVISAHAVPGENVVPDVRFSDFALYKEPINLPIGNSLTVKHDAVLLAAVLGGGWSMLEGDFVWMDQPQAHLTLGVGKGFTGDIALDLSAFVPRPDSVQRISITVDGQAPVTALFDSKTNRQTVFVPLKDTTTDGVVISIVDHDLISPESISLSQDPRTLGVSLYGIKIQGK